jgi:hypothetical protein
VTRQLLPLTVWLCPDALAQSDVPVGTNRKGKKKTEVCLRHRRAVGRELARHLITTCTREGELVAEAYTTSDATLWAAAELGRRAIACVPHFPLAQHIGGGLRAGFPAEKLAGLAMRPCRPDQMARGLADKLEQVALVVAAPPPYPTGPGAEPTERRCPACLSDALVASELRLNGFLLAAWRVLRRGGHLAVITTARHEAGRLVDPAPQIIRQARELGFTYSQHVIALRVPIEGDELVVQSTPGEIAQLRDVRSRALPPAVAVHADLCIFTKRQPFAAPAAEGGRR